MRFKGYKVVRFRVISFEPRTLNLEPRTPNPEL